MSAVSHAHPGQLTLGGLLLRLVIIVLLWAGLVVGLLMYVGHDLPTEYQLSVARTEAAEKSAHEALNPPKAEAPAATPAPAKSAASASAAGSAAPATSAAADSVVTSTPAPGTKASSAKSAPATGSVAAAGSAPAPAPKAGTAPKELPKDVRLAGLNRTALTNVSIFYAIVVSVCFIGVIILQFFKYCHREEESGHAH
ncbi:MAG TPA: hypothetical protein VK737_07195 [Opitutales bacterium]|jgi:hypothetical protein|nr:hypothetical protein [Opitutales bacterium]